jgi:prepilin peptidase CpaA
MSTQEIALHVAVGLAALTVGFLLFTFGSFGGGDAKLLAACALWMGSAHIATFLVVVGLAGGLLATVILGYRQRPVPTFLLRQTWAMALHERRAGIPYGIAIATAMLFVLPSTHWFNYLI